MPGGETPAAPRPGDPPGRGDRGPFGRLVLALNVLATLMLIGLMVLINADVVGRNLLRAPIPGVVELTEAAMVMLVFLQLGHTLRRDRFMRSDGMLRLVERRLPRLGAGMNLVFDLAGAALFALIAWAVHDRAFDAWTGGYYKGIRGNFTLPTWPIEAAILIGAVVMVVQFLALARGDLLGLAAPSAAPREDRS